MSISARGTAAISEHRHSKSPDFCTLVNRYGH